MVITLTATVEVHGRKASVESIVQEDGSLTLDELHEMLVELTVEEHCRLRDALIKIGLAPTIKQGEAS